MAVLLAATILLTPGVSSAKPSQGQINAAAQARNAASQQLKDIAGKVASAQASVNTAHAQSALALDTYQGKEAQYETAQAAATTAASNAAKADADLRAAHTQLVSFARRSYMRGSTAPEYQALLSADGPAQLLERSTLLEAAGAHRTDVVVQFTGVQKQAKVAATAAQSTATQAAALKDEAAQALATAEQAETTARTQEAQVQAQQVTLQTQLDQAQATLTRLVGAKAAADQQAAAEAAAQQAADDAARKAADDASNDDSTPNNPAEAGPGSSSAADTAIAAAKRWLGTPYAWGGGSLTGPSRGIGIDAGVVGFDCSGLTRYAYHQAGIDIPRNSSAQYAALPKVSRNNLQPGDLVFYAFDTSRPSTIHHVAMYLGHDQIIEAPESGLTVRITAMRWGSYIGAARPGA